jgi:hypothetical protein
LQTLGIDFDLVNRGDEFDELEFADGRQTTAGTAVAGEASITVSPPTESPPPLPDSRFKWTERLFLDDLLAPTLIGRDAMRLIMSQKGSQIKQLEAKENCKILFRGAIARDIFSTENAGIEPDVDIRFHAIILCDSPTQALIIRKALINMVRQAEEAGRAAKAAVKDKAHATGGDRAIGLRSRWVATMADAHEAAGHFWRLNPAAFHALLQKLADDEVRAGKRSIPGFTVTEERCL